MARPSYLRSLLAALLVAALAAPALAATCAPARTERPRCPLMAAGACPLTPAARHGHGGEVGPQAMDCCDGPRLPADSPAALAPAPTLTPAAVGSPASTALSLQAAIHPAPRATVARSSPKALYTLFRSLLI